MRKDKYISKEYGISDEDIIIDYTNFYDWFTELNTNARSVGFAIKLGLNQMLADYTRVKPDKVKRVIQEKLIEDTVKGYMNMCDMLLGLRAELGVEDYLRSNVDENEKLLLMIEETAEQTKTLINDIIKTWKK